MKLYHFIELDMRIPCGAIRTGRIDADSVPGLHYHHTYSVSLGIPIRNIPCIVYTVCRKQTPLRSLACDRAAHDKS